MSRDPHPLAGQALTLVLLNPSTTGGARTLARASKLAALLGSPHYQVLNMCAMPSRSIHDLKIVGANEEPWLLARLELRRMITPAARVLLAYGVQSPGGSAGIHFRDQASWLSEHLNQVGAEVWTIGGRPCHPSRWQRHTHKLHPTRNFDDALLLSLVREAALSNTTIANQ